METVWSFYSGTYLIVLNVTPDYGYQYDGDDEDGATQAALDSGEYVAFDAEVQVIDKHGVIIGRDSLGGSVYAAGEISDFWIAHRSSDPLNRNCTIMRQTRGGSPDAKISICHYFPGMVAAAVAEARDYLRDTSSRYVRLAA